MINYLKNINAVSMLFFLFLGSINTGAQNIPSADNRIVFIDYPGFEDQHSTWNDIGYSAYHNKVYVGVTNHHDKIVLYEYDVDQDIMGNCGFIDEMVNLREFQWQGKIHSKIVEGAEGVMYFSTDGGESREEYLMNNPHGYAGGYYMSYDPSTRQLSNLGMGQPNQGRFVEVVQYLAHQPGQGNGNRHHVGVEIALVQEWFDGLPQIVLGRLDGQKDRPGVRSPEAGRGSS